MKLMENEISENIISETKILKSFEIHLFIQLYPSERNEEILTAVNKNIENPMIDKIHLFIEGIFEKLPENEKVILYRDTERMTFLDFFEFINKNIPDNTYCIVSNNDIEFTDLSKVKKLFLHDTCICLSRWEFTEHYPPPYKYECEYSNEFVLKKSNISQDSWIFQSPIKIPNFCDFYSGTMGCDNRLSMELSKVGYKLLNTPWDIKTIHHHKSNVRELRDTILGDHGKVDLTKLEFKY